ncbi:class I SAM-dependent methyltransferase [Isosphaeraceae bacterium EP7]
MSSEAPPHLEVQILCPACRTPLQATTPQSWTCDGCSATYRGLRGIPDLRIEDDVYLDNEADWAIAEALDAEFDRHDFDGLLARFFELSGDVPEADRSRYARHIRTAPGRVGGWIGPLGEVGEGAGLDLGCGSGSFLASAQATGRTWVGVDIAMRWLLVARKRLDEGGLHRARLVCGGSERLPFADGQFAALVSGDVIEHVRDQAATIGETFRVLKPGGRAMFATPNRFSLGAEPHVGVFGVGYLPRAWMGWYVRVWTGRDYRAIRNLGAGEFSQLLKSSPFGGGSILAPLLPAADLAHFSPLKRRLGQLYNRLASTWAGQWLARRIGPILHAVVERPSPPVQSSILPTRPGSRGRAAGA